MNRYKESQVQELQLQAKRAKYPVSRYIAQEKKHWCLPISSCVRGKFHVRATRNKKLSLPGSPIICTAFFPYLLIVFFFPPYNKLSSHSILIFHEASGFRPIIKHYRYELASHKERSSMQ